MYFFFFSSRRRHTRWNCDWSSDVCSSDLRVSWIVRQGFGEELLLLQWVSNRQGRAELEVRAFGGLDAALSALAEDLRQVRGLLLLGELVAQRQQRSVAPVLLERRGRLRQAFRRPPEPVRRDGGDQGPVRRAGRPLRALPAEPQDPFPIVAGARPQQHGREPNRIVGVRLPELARGLLVQRRQLSRPRVLCRRLWGANLRPQCVEEQHGAAEQLRSVDRIARRACGAHEQAGGQRAIAVALRRLHARLEQGRMVGGELQRVVDEPLRILDPAEAAQQQRLRAQRLGAVVAVLEQRLLALVQRQGLLVTPHAGEQPARRLERRAVLRIDQTGILVAGGRALGVAELLDEDSPHRVMYLSGSRSQALGPRFRLEMRDLTPGGLDLRICRLSLRRLERKLLRDDRVHADLDRTRAAALESLLGSGDRARDSATFYGGCVPGVECGRTYLTPSKRGQTVRLTSNRALPRPSPPLRSPAASPAQPRCPCATRGPPPCTPP